MRTNQHFSVARTFLPGYINNTTSIYSYMNTVLLKLKRHGLAFLVTQLFLVTLAFGQATVTTDKADYAPGEVLVITGSGWDPGEVVKLNIVETPTLCPNGHNLYDTADENGNIFNNAFVFNIRHVGITFTLTATGLSSGLTAQTTFTDANTALSNPTPTTAVYGSTITISSTLTQQGNDNSCVACVGPGNPIPGKTLVFTINNGTSWGSGITNSSGVGSTTVTVTLPVGTYNGNDRLRVSFAGDATPYASQLAQATFEVTPATTSLSAVSGSGVYGNAATLTATSSLAIAGISVSFSLDGTAVGSALTNASGVATLSVPFTSIPATVRNAGTHTNEVQASIAATGNYSAASAQGNLAITARAITVTPNAGQSKIYGSLDPAFTFTGSEALLPGNSYTGALGRGG